MTARLITSSAALVTSIAFSARSASSAAIQRSTMSAVTLTARSTKRLFHLVFESHDGTLKVRPRCAAGDWARTGQLANESAHRDDEPWDATKRFLYHLICPGRGVRPFADENREIGSANAHVTGDAFHLGRTAPVKVHHRPASAVPASPPMRKQANKAGPCLSRAGHSSLHADSSVALLRVEPTQRRAVAQQDPAPLWHLDRRRILQMLERARYGLDGEAEIVGDILTRHR